MATVIQGGKDVELKHRKENVLNIFWNKSKSIYRRYDKVLKRKKINENLKFGWQKRVVCERGKKKRDFALGRIGKEGCGVQSLI